MKGRQPRKRGLSLSRANVGLFFGGSGAALKATFRMYAREKGAQGPTLPPMAQSSSGLRSCQHLQGD